MSKLYRFGKREKTILILNVMKDRNEIDLILKNCN